MEESNKDKTQAKKSDADLERSLTGMGKLRPTKEESQDTPSSSDQGESVQDNDAKNQ